MQITIDFLSMLIGSVLTISLFLTTLWLRTSGVLVSEKLYLNVLREKTQLQHEELDSLILRLNRYFDLFEEEGILPQLEKDDLT